MPLKFKYFLLSVLLVLTMCPNASSQTFSSDNNTPKFNSPYSRIGLGDLANQNFSISSAMGGLGASFNSRYSVNLVNPASVGFIDRTVFDVNGFFRYGQLDSGSETINTFAGNFQYLSLGFPMKNEVNIELDNRPPLVYWRMNLALVPFSNVGFNVETNSSTQTDSLNTSFTGKGGTYKLIWTNALRHKDFSFGINAGYMFGNLINERIVVIEDPENVYFNDLLDEISLSGIVWSFGAQYKHQFKKLNDKKELVNSGRSITAGVYLNSQSEINSNTSQLYRRRSSTFSPPQGIDTIRNVVDLKGNAIIPGGFGVGVTYEIENKFRVGIDYSASQWSNYENEFKAEDLLDSWRVAAGGEWIPNVSSYNKYMDRVRYRFGVFYEQDPRSDEFNEQLSVFGITVGTGMPIILPRGQTAFFNLGLELGRFGTTNSLNESYVQLNLGFTLNDNLWFYKRKFN